MSKLMKIILLIAYSFVLIKYLVTSITLTHNVEISYLIGKEKEGKSIRSLLKLFKNNVTALRNSFKKMKRFPTDFKFILQNTNEFLNYAAADSIKTDMNGQQTFIENKCKYINCFVTNNKDLLHDIRHFDAIIYHVENNWDEGILLREPHQKYIFVAKESSENYPLCDAFFNNFYNLTMTYKLNSDIPWTYFQITDKLGEVVGPRVDMTWIDPMDPTPASVKEKISSKKKAAAWFVSKCNTKSNRGPMAEAIQSELYKRGHILDIFGWCGKRSCPKDRHEECLSLLESDYYFYLAFENSFSEDYVTEQLFEPLQHFAVPIVYGGADYSRFLSPNSYIDARKLNVTQIVEEMIKAMNNVTIYENYFKWHNYYNYTLSAKEPDVCKLCQILNEEAHIRSSYKNFLGWWNHRYRDKCSKEIGRVIVKDPQNPLYYKNEDLLIL